VGRLAHWGPRLRAVLLVALVVAVGLPAANAHATPLTAATAAQAPASKASILVDADTGNVLAAQGERQLMYPASTIKLLTALMAVERLPPGDLVPITALAESMPARSMNVKAGQQWALVDLLHALLMVSANDTAVAIAERVGGGSLERWSELAQQTASNLGLIDHPVFHDPAGLDDALFGQGGGSQISARDLAIIGRAVLARPDLLAIIQTKHYEFAGGDGNGHELNNQDPFLSIYAGAVGLKTGATDKAGHTFVGAATRNGRTMLAVVLDGVDPIVSVESMLDAGFATPVNGESTADVLPAVVPDAAIAGPATAASDDLHAAEVGAPAAGHGGGRGSPLDSPPVAVAIFLCGLVLLAVVRRAMLDRFEHQREQLG
jgi:D-alanyl-D-alanine carboxypeptidase (penicillin-binding protein 5/6)